MHPKKNICWEKMKNCYSCLVLSRFKGHIQSGYEGALKQLSIGFSSIAGKVLEYTGG